MSIPIASSSDAQLVAASLGGNREAFGALVERHQQVVCAIAYARTGSLAASEDIAQETFLAAWKNLARIKAPENFRGWLCGTVRHLAAKFHRQETHSIPLTDDIADPQIAGPGETAISREEEAMLWAALEQLPGNHREPIILFYRGGHSVREIANTLELSEDAVKQRLSRGRVMLQETVRKKVESVLAHSRPGAAFTITVLAAIPVMTASAQAAGAGLALAKGSGAIATTGVLSMLGGLFIGLAGAWFGIKCSLDRAESERERKFIWSVGRWSAGCMAVSLAILMALVVWARPMQAARPGLWIFLMAANILCLCAVMLIFGIRNTRLQQRIREAERIRRGAPVAEKYAGIYEYRSRLQFLGLPLVHCRFGGPGLGVAKGWIAFGNIAVAPLLAFGGVAIGGISFGGLGIGLVASAGIGLGLFSFSGLALGGLAVGGLAIGWIAVGGAAWGWLAAMGGQARAGLYGMGYHVSAPHANDAIAKAFFQETGLAQAAQMIATNGAWAQVAIALPVFVALYQMRKIRRQTPRKPRL